MSFVDPEDGVVTTQIPAQGVSRVALIGSLGENRTSNEEFDRKVSNHSSSGHDVNLCLPIGGIGFNPPVSMAFGLG